MAPGCVTELYAVNAEAKAIACSSMESSCLCAKKKRSDGRIIPPESANDRCRRLPAPESAVRAIVSGVTLAASYTTGNESPAAEDKTAGPSWRSMSPGLGGPNKSPAQIPHGPMPYL